MLEGVSETEKQAASPDAAPLTERQESVAKLLARGLAPKEIAVELQISRDQVYEHIANIRARWGVSTQQGIVAKVFELGLL
jgi:DNA-binding CsgD family transcriptional regulator